jgi:hypothetical protein
MKRLLGKVGIGGGEAIYIREGESHCEVHELSDDKVAHAILAAMLTRVPAGITVCRDCLERMRRYKDNRLAEVKQTHEEN